MLRRPICMIKRLLALNEYVPGTYVHVHFLVIYCADGVSQAEASIWLISYVCDTSIGQLNQLWYVFSYVPNTISSQLREENLARKILHADVAASCMLKIARCDVCDTTDVRWSILCRSVDHIDNSRAACMHVTQVAGNLLPIYVINFLF